MNSWRGLVRLCSVVLLYGLVFLGGASCDDSGTAPSPSPMVFDVTPSVLSLVIGASANLKATLSAEDGESVDVTDRVTWLSDAPDVATVYAGKVNAVAAGVAVVSVSSGPRTKTVTVTVKTSDSPLVSLNVGPPTLTLAKGLQKQLIATGTYADGSTKDVSSQAVWSSATASVATVDSTGKLTSLLVGTSKITAALAGIVGSTVVTVTDAAVASIAVTPSNPSVAAGVTQAFTATATMTDNTTKDLTTQATWTSGTSAVATIASTGIAKGLSKGTSTMTATFDGVSGSTLLTVTDATLVSIAVTPANASIPVGRTQQLTATGTFSDASTKDIKETVAWTSGDLTSASVSNAAGSKGLVTGIAQGTPVITATSGTIMGSAAVDVSSAVLVSIQVTPANPTVATGVNRQFTARGTYSDGTMMDVTSMATWASADTAVATISNAAGSSGIATTIAAGTTTISATLTGVSGSTVLTVTP